MASVVRIPHRYRGKAIPPNPDVAERGQVAMAETTAKEAVKVGLVEKEGSTRGKNPRKITYMAFDTSVPESLPKTLAQFAEVTGTKSENELLEYVIDGFNAAAYAAASDEIGEFIPDSWDKEVQAQFRLAVRNFSKMTGMSIEDSVGVIKPQVEKALAAKAAAAKAEAEKAQPVTA